MHPFPLALPRWALAGAAVMALALALHAQEEKKEEKKEEKPEYPPVETVLKDTTKIEGFLTLHYNAKTDELFLELPRGVLDKPTDFLLASSLSASGPLTGFQWDTGLLRWEEQGKNVLLIAPEVRHVRAPSTVKEVIERTYSDAIVGVLPIKTKTGKGAPVVDFGALLKGGFSDFAGVLGGKPRPDLSRIGKISSFPKNTEIPVTIAVMNGDSGTRGTIHFSFSELPETGYKPRLADDRIGYFQTVMRDWSKRHDEKTNFIRYINRWHLEKQDPSLDLSPPKEPIVFYIEKTVPVPFRRYVKEGIEEWNKAFELCGFLDAIVVRQQTETQFQDLDPEDVRYNFFRWIVSGRAFAMGPSRVNPRTGQILDADIIMDDSFVRYFIEDYEANSNVSLAPYAEHDPLLASFLAQHPQWQRRTRLEHLLGNTMPAGQELLASNLDASLLGERPVTSDALLHPCQAAAGTVHQINLLRADLAAQGKPLPLEFLGQLLREVVMHEVGHTLGLRHNFKASSWLDMQAINAAKGGTTATVASVMDYNGAIFHPEKAEQGDYTTATLGPYDHWAIGYGYRAVGEPYKEEAEMLKAIAARSGEPGHAYATDEDTSLLGPDPHINRYDMSSDNIAFARQQVALSQKLLKNVEEWAVEDGESWYALRRNFSMILGEHGRVAIFVARYVGGQFYSRSHKGDQNAPAPLEVVPAARQREAMAYLAEHIFADTHWRFSPQLLARLGAGRYGHWDSDENSPSLDFDLGDRIESIQANVLMVLMNPMTLGRLHDSPSKVAAGQECYTVPEHFQRLEAAIWGELDRDPAQLKEGEEFISPTRRALQRLHLGILIDLVLARPGGPLPADVNALARHSLRGLGTRVTRAAATDGLDAYSAAHLLDSSERITAALAAAYELSR